MFFYFFDYVGVGDDLTGYFSWRELNSYVETGDGLNVEALEGYKFDCLNRFCGCKIYTTNFDIYVGLVKVYFLRGVIAFEYNWKRSHFLFCTRTS